MKTRKLGKTGIEVSEIAFGGVEIGIPYGIGIESEKDMLSEAEAIQLLHTSIDSGINFFDTARLYGNSEYIMGKAFRDRRDQVILSTKCKHFRNHKGKIPGYAILRETIETSLKESLDALQTDYVDVFMLHQADMEILENDDVSDIFQNLKNSGMIRATGASTYSSTETSKVIESGLWDVVQLPFNLMDQRQEAFFAIAAEKGIGIVIRSVLLKGLLSDRGKNLHSALKEVQEHIGYYNELLNDDFPDLPALATKFALSFAQVSSILVGIDRTEYLHKSIAAASGGDLDRATIAKARSLSYPEPEFLNLPYWDKMGWLK